MRVRIASGTEGHPGACEKGRATCHSRMNPGRIAEGPVDAGSSETPVWSAARLACLTNCFAGSVDEAAVEQTPVPGDKDPWK